MPDARWYILHIWSSCSPISVFAARSARVRMGHGYDESDDAIVSCIICLCFAMYHMDVIDVSLSSMTPVNQCHFP